MRAKIADDVRRACGPFVAGAEACRFLARGDLREVPRERGPGGESYGSAGSRAKGRQVAERQVQGVVQVGRGSYVVSYWLRLVKIFHTRSVEVYH